ncbi:MAG: DMT family transporter [Candidatus Helarchaeota archaeon]
MVRREIKLGLFFAGIANIVGGFQPVWANMRPPELDAHLFSGMSTLFQAFIFLPIFLFEYFFFTKSKRTARPKKSQSSNPSDASYRLIFGSSKIILFIVIGTLFSVVLFLYYYGLYLAGSINGTLALKSTAIFGIVFGFFLLKEEVTKLQIGFAVILFFGMTLAITQGDFNLLQLNIGVIIILICAAIWMVGHAFSKPYLTKGIITSSELVLMRNIFSSAVLLLSYYFMFGDQILIVLSPNFALYYILMGVIYGFNLFCWYKMLQYLDISMASILITPQLIVTAYFGSLLLDEPFTVFHLIGLIIMLFSILGMNYKGIRRFYRKEPHLPS